MTKEQIKKVTKIITDMVIEESRCMDCEYYREGQNKICNGCFLYEKLKLNKGNLKYIIEKVNEIKIALQ